MTLFADPVEPMSAADQAAAWAPSGAMALTGRTHGPPLGPPDGLVPKLRALRRALTASATRVGGAVDVDPLPLLGERAAIGGLHRRGSTSVGGASRLVRAGDGEWLAVSLARPDDVALVPAWLEVPVHGDPWPVVETEVRDRRAHEVVERARLVGLPASVLGEAVDRRPPVVAHGAGPVEPARRLDDVTVVELASLWAGPLCGSLLRSAGVTVIKVESINRPDGARRGPPAFFDLLNAGKRSAAVDLPTREGVRRLTALLRSADVVIDGSRPRALEQLGIDAASLLADERPRVWLSITGHGRESGARDWVAFGDDAAVAGGLVARDDDGPVFCADAVADPLAGVVAANAVLDALGAGARTLLDVALSSVAAAFAGPTLPVPPGTVAASPMARPSPGRGPRLAPPLTEPGWERTQK